MYLVTVSLRASNWGMSISAMIRQQDVRHQGATFISRITLKKDGDDSSCWYTRAALYSPPVMEWRDHRSPGNYTFPQKHLFLWSCCHEPKAVTLRYEEVFFFFLSIYSGFLHPNKLSTRPLNTMNVSPCSTFNIPPSPPQMQLHLVSNHRIAAFKNTKVYSTQHSSSSNRALFVFNRSGKGQTTHYFILCWE